MAGDKVIKVGLNVEAVALIIMGHMTEPPSFPRMSHDLKKLCGINITVRKIS